MSIFSAIAAIDAVAGAGAATGAADGAPPKGLDPLSAALAKGIAADIPTMQYESSCISTPGDGQAKGACLAK